MRKISLVVLVLIVLSGCEGKGLESKSNPEAEKAATESVEAWLILVDAGRYSESWEQTAEFFKESISRDTWLIYFKKLREPLGGMISRKLILCQYTTSLPGAPKGEYVVIRYSTIFEKKRSVIETVTPALDRDGRWRVSGYYID